MPYIIAGTATYSSQAFRDAAVTRLNTTLASLSLNPRASATITAGVATPTATTLTVSFEVAEGQDPSVASKAIYDAWVQSNRHASGFLSVSLVP